jgi:hypothetical protein
MLKVVPELAFPPVFDKYDDFPALTEFVSFVLEHFCMLMVVVWS